MEPIGSPQTPGALALLAFSAGLGRILALRSSAPLRRSPSWRGGLHPAQQALFRPRAKRHDPFGVRNDGGLREQSPAAVRRRCWALDPLHATRATPIGQESA